MEMTLQTRQLFRSEIKLAADALHLRRYESALHHLTRAHELGFYFVLPHMQAHFGMFRVALARGDIRKTLLQPLLIFLALFSRVTSPLVAGAMVHRRS